MVPQLLGMLHKIDRDHGHRLRTVIIGTGKSLSRGGSANGRSLGVGWGH